jgi:hypothetical protein
MLRVAVQAGLVVACCAITGAKADVYGWSCAFPNFNAPLVFVLDTATRTGTMVGNAGSTRLATHVGKSLNGDVIVSFIEYVESGAVMTTTINAANGAAVHSRNTVQSGQLNPSQVKGQCAVRD